MTDNKRVSSADKTRFIEIVETDLGVFELRSFVVRFDPEEEVEYTIRSLPDPTSKFSCEASALEEAKRLLQ